MRIADETRDLLFRISGEDEFTGLALEIFRLQSSQVGVYRKFCELLGKSPENVHSVSDIPFLPISFFKEQMVYPETGEPPEMVFTSSGTTGSVPSRHYIRDLNLYSESFTRSFSLFFGDPLQYRFLALLPGYLEREGSSLVYMMDRLVSLTATNGSGFFLHDMARLADEITRHNDHFRTVLFGASYALLDFAEKFRGDYKDLIVMETGGMKGRKREMVREELHEALCSGLGVSVVHSEYGMTELLSQAYSRGGGIFRSPPWMKVLARDVNDPLELLGAGKTGGINVIDLANLNSCAFIATQDLGKVHEDGSFEVLGRFDDSDIRGCNLLVV